MSDDAFGELVERGIAALRPDVRARLTHVVILVADRPTRRQRRTLNLGPGETLFGLYEGVPQTERGLDDAPLLPDTITIFKAPILETYSDPEDIAACVANTIWHEVAHYFGMDEETVVAEEERRGKFH